MILRYHDFFGEEILYTDLRKNGIISTNILTKLRRIRNTKGEYKGMNKKRVWTVLTELARRVAKWYSDTILSEEFSIQQKIMNLILTTALGGGSVALFVTTVLGAYESAAIIGVVLLVVCASLYMSLKKKNILFVVNSPVC